mgnify:CR=1 FL=1
MSIEAIAQRLVAPGKGILAADESTGTIGKRFERYSIPNTEDKRRSYRDLLFTTPGIEPFISGVILFDETFRQNGLDGALFTELLTARGIAPGIKVDQGTESYGNDESITNGLDGLEVRLAEYAELGAQFTKWRGVIKIGKKIPTDECIRENAKRLAEFARLSQKKKMVPIVEPEVLMDGGHSIGKCFDVTNRTLQFVFEELKNAGVNLKGMLLKPNMVIAGVDSLTPSTTEEVARKTLKCFMGVVPKDVPGIVFLSGGQSDEDAAKNLNEMNKGQVKPWELSFSFGRGLQSAALNALAGQLDDSTHRAAAQKALFKSAQQCSLARSGKL